MTKEKLKDIEDRLAKRLGSILSIPPAQIKLNSPLHDLGVDSLSFVELLVFIEKEFDLKLMESAIAKEDFKSIHSLALCISKIK